MFTEAEVVWFATSTGNKHLRDTLDWHSDGSNSELLPAHHSVTERSEGFGRSPACRLT